MEKESETLEGQDVLEAGEGRELLGARILRLVSQEFNGVADVWYSFCK